MHRVQDLSTLLCTLFLGREYDLLTFLKRNYENEKSFYWQRLLFLIHFFLYRILLVYLFVYGFVFLF